VDVTNEGVYRIQSRRKHAFRGLSARLLGEMDKEIPAPVSAADCYDLLQTSRAPSSSKGFLPEMTCPTTSSADAAPMVTDLMHVRPLTWAFLVSLPGAQRRWAFAFGQHDIRLKRSCCLQIGFSGQYPRFAIEIKSIFGHRHWTLTQLVVIARHDEIQWKLRFG
jgi:hypothetical protein